MVVVAWILLVVFGYLGITSLGKYMFGSISKAQAVLMVVSVIISALACGVLFGDLSFTFIK